MKLKIEGFGEFDARNLQSAAPLHMIELQSQSKKLIDGGWKLSVLRQADREGKAYARQRAAWIEAGADPDLEPDEPDSLWVALATTNFLTLRAGGVKISLEDAASIPISALEFVPEAGDQALAEDDEGGGADPTTPGRPAPAGPETPADVPPALDLPVGA